MVLTRTHRSKHTDESDALISDVNISTELVADAPEPTADAPEPTADAPEPTADAPKATPHIVVHDTESDEEDANHSTSAAASLKTPATPSPEGLKMPPKSKSVPVKAEPVTPTLPITPPKKAPVMSPPTSQTPVPTETETPVRPLTQLDSRTALITHYLVPTTAQIDLVDQARERLEQNQSAVWPGNINFIEENCEWRNNSVTGCCEMAWKDYAPDPALTVDVDGQGDEPVLFGYIGTVTVNGSNMAPDALHITTFPEADVVKKKRNVAVSCPRHDSGIPHEWWLTQISGVRNIINDGRRSRYGVQHKLGNCFFDAENNTLRARSSLFLPFPGGIIDDGHNENATMELDTLRSHRYFTWKFSSTDVRAVFDRVVRRGYEPQVLDVRSSLNRPIHPNDVQSALTGSIVMVWCTLERSIYGNPRNGEENRVTNFYANLLKVQVLKPAPPFQAIAQKRKVANAFGPGGSSGGSSMSKSKNAKLSNTTVSKFRKLTIS
ncbi:hypothetical protein FRC11_006913 [Ceratobasidium sp. 423]|nr:hypothetical protein FRC11_006913 [Ceratobasidium sp. 423]